MGAANVIELQTKVRDDITHGSAEWPVTVIAARRGNSATDDTYDMGMWGPENIKIKKI